MKRGRGRGRKPLANPQKELLSVPVTKELKERIVQTAIANGCTVAELVRNRMIAAEAEREPAAA